MSKKLGKSLKGFEIKIKKINSIKSAFMSQTSTLASFSLFYFWPLYLLQFVVSLSLSFSFSLSLSLSSLFFFLSQNVSFFYHWDYDLSLFVINQLWLSLIAYMSLHPIVLLTFFYFQFRLSLIFSCSLHYLVNVIKLFFNFNFSYTNN
jgi:hypothetical protein